MSAHEKNSPAELQSAEELSKTSGTKYTHYRQEDLVTASPDRNGRINPDSRQMLWLAVTLVGFVGAISFMVSFSGLVAVAEWAGLPRGMRWTVPVFIDTAILVYSIAVLVHRSRGEKTWASWLSLSAFTFVSVLANVGHVLLLDQALDEFKTGIGAIVAGMAPIGVFAATEELGRLAIARPRKRQTDDSLVQVGEDRPNTTPPTTPGHRTPELEVATPVVTNAEPLATNDNQQVTPDPEPAVASTGEAEPVARKVFEFYPFDQNTAGLEWGRTHIPVRETSPSKPVAPAPAVSEPENDTAPAPTPEKPALSAVSYMTPADQEQQTIDGLLATHGSDLTAQIVADAFGKTLRTGQRKLTRIKAKHPEFFSSIENSKEA